MSDIVFLHPQPVPEPTEGFMVVFRESDRLLADAFDTDVPLIANSPLPPKPDTP